MPKYLVFDPCDNTFLGYDRYHLFVVGWYEITLIHMAKEFKDETVAREYMELNYGQSVNKRIQVIDYDVASVIVM